MDPRLNRVWQLIPKSCHRHRETAVTVPDGLREWHRAIVRQKRTSTLDVGGAGPVAQQDTPVLGHASRSTLLSAVCRSAGRVIFFPINAPGMDRFQLLNFGVLGYALELRFWVVIAIIVSLTLTITLITTLTIIQP